MRLSEEKARALNALVWRDRMKRVLPVVAAAICAIAVLTVFLVRQVEKADRTVDVQVHKATVVHVKKHSNGRGAGIVEVHLDDGRDVEAFSGLRFDLAVGAHVVINESRHASGKLTYDIASVQE